MKGKRVGGRWGAGAAVAAAVMVASASHAASGPAAAPMGDERIRVQLMSRQAVTLSGELAAKIAALPVLEGNAFQKGQVLIEFDCSSYRAQLARAQASMEAAAELLQVDQQLAKLNSLGTLELTQAQGKAKETAADLSYMQGLVSKCEVTAPFAGRVARRHAAVHQYVSPGNPIIDIVDTGPLELRMLVPSKSLTRLKAGEHFTVAVDELGRSVPARIERLGAQIDPVSQSILVIGVVDGPGRNLLPGMSGWASLH